MSELATLARPYAKAIFNQAVDTNSAAKWSEMLGLFSLVVSDPEMSVVIKNPRVTAASLLKLLLDICAGQINAEGTNLLKMLVQNKRLNLLQEIARLYEEHKASHEGYVDVNVLSAFAFTKTDEKSFAAALEKKLNIKVRMSVAVDKSLIGGVLIRAGDLVIDQSIRCQLQQLAKQL